MPITASSGSTTTRAKPKQYICYLCSKTFDSIDTLNSHKRLDHGSTESGKSTKPQPPAGMGEDRSRVILHTIFSFSFRQTTAVLN